MSVLPRPSLRPRNDGKIRLDLNSSISNADDRSGAADQPRQLLEAAADAVATRSTIWCSNTSINLRSWLRKWVAAHAAGPPRSDGDPKRPRAAGAFQQGRRQLFHDRGRRLIFLAQARIAEDTDSPTKAGLWVMAEIAVGDELERLLAAVVRMHRQEISDKRQAA